jgi:hypothetical protein
MNMVQGQGCNPATERGSKFNDRFRFNISGELPVRMPLPEFLSQLLISPYKECPAGNSLLRGI